MHHRIPRLFAAAALATPLLSASSSALADPFYTVTVVAGAGSYAYDLNNLGQVVGSMDTGGQYHAFVSNGSAPTDLGTLGGSNSSALSINDHGQIVGDSYVSGDAYNHGFIVNGGSMSALPGQNLLGASAINNAGTVAGTMTVPTPNGDQMHAYTYAAGGGFTDLGTLPIGDGSFASAINGAGDVVGAANSMINGFPNVPQDPFLVHNGTMIDLGTLDPNGIWTGATSINDHGQIVGHAGLGPDPDNPGGLYPQTAFLYENGVLKNLGGLAPHASSAALDINNLGQIVGAASLGTGFSHGFLYENGKMFDLNSLIDPAGGWTIEGASAINDLQQIAARACRNGVCQAVRLDLAPAVPEPPMAALLLAGLALAGRRVARRFRTPVLRRPG
jgi:probable HAF family extracellular repeat protein